MRIWAEREAECFGRSFAALGILRSVQRRGEKFEPKKKVSADQIKHGPLVLVMASSPAKRPAISKSTVNEQDKKRKTVFRQILDTPYNVTWYKSIL